MPWHWGAACGTARRVGRIERIERCGSRAGSRVAADRYGPAGGLDQLLKGTPARALGMPSRAPNAARQTTAPRRNFLYSLVAGGAVLGAIALAITAVSSFDPVKRG